MEDARSPRRRGPQKRPKKLRVTIRLDQQVIEDLKEVVRLAPDRKAWQTEANRLLAIAARDERELRESIKRGRLLAEELNPWGGW